jgi:prophage regulatory protein
MHHEIEPELLRPAQAAQYLGMSRSRLWRLSETDSTFPRKIVISARTVGWLRGDLLNWLQQQRDKQ